MSRSPGPEASPTPSSPPPFDSMLASAASGLRVPHAFIAVGERDSPISIHASAPPAGCAEPPLSVSPLVRLLCQWVVRTAAPLAVADARQHPLVRDVVAARESDGAGFLGVPISGAGGVAGCLCVMDDRRREWRAEEIAALREIAALPGGVGEPAGAGEPARGGPGGSEDECFRQMFARGPLPMWIFDLETLRFLAVNDAAVQHYGFTREEFLAMTILEIRPEAEMPALSALLASSPAGSMRRLTTQHRTRAGAIIHVDVTCQPTVFRSRPALLAFVMDVSQRKQEEQEQRFLAEATALLVTMLDYHTRLAQLARLSVPMLGDYCVVDVVEDDGSLRRIEAAHADPGREQLVRGLLRFAPQPGAREGVCRALQEGKPIHIAHTDDSMLQRMAQGPEHLQLLRQLGPRSLITVPLSARGHTFGAISFVMAESGRDFGPRSLQLAGELAHRAAFVIDNARLYRRAQQAIRAREEVLNVVSHDLRNPLNATLLTLESLVDSGSEMLSARQRQQLASVGRFTEQMVRLVDDLIDGARAEADYLRVHPRPYEVRPLLEGALEAVAAAAAARDVELRVHLADGLPAVRADGQRVLQVLDNLLSNAVRLVPRGGRVRIEAERADHRVRFAVADSGPGIPRDQLSKLFDRGAPGRSRSGGGLGLGLVIASGIVRAHGGEIWAESQPGEGSTFYFTLPAADAASPEPEAPVDDVLAAIPVFRSVDEVDDTEPRWSGAADPRERAESALRGSRFLAAVADSPTMRGAGARADLYHFLRRRIMTAVHLGHLRAGDRLPSIREVTRQFGISHHTAVQMYERLAADGLVEKRERSGIYVADPSQPHRELLVETGSWIADVLTQACEHHIRIPRLPELLRRWTAAVRLRCACIESDRDHLRALCLEFSSQFGAECTPVITDALASAEGGEIDIDALPPEIRVADILMTTTFHAPRVRALAAALAKPLVVVKADPRVVALIERRLQDGCVTLVCSDPRFGERVAEMRAGTPSDRLRVVLASDARALARLDRSEPILLTRAAREEVDKLDVRLLTPHFPVFSMESAREFAAIMVQLHMEAERRPALQPG